MWPLGGWLCNTRIGSPNNEYLREGSEDMNLNISVVYTTQAIIISNVRVNLK